MDQKDDLGHHSELGYIALDSPQICSLEAATREKVLQHLPCELTWV